MRAHILLHYGKTNDVVALRERPDRPLAPGEARIRMRAVGLNPVDLKTREGEPKAILPFAPPFVLGVDVAGTIEEIGPGVSRLAVGEDVFAYAGMDRMGTLAERVVLPADRVARAPRGLSHEICACLPLAGLCALQALDAAPVGAGARVLVHGGAGAVGSLAVQLASRRGAEVFATASASDGERVRALGAREVFDFRVERFEDRVRDVDLVLDTVGGETLSRSFGATRPGGVVASLRVPPSADALVRAGLRAPWWLRLALPLVTRAPRASARRTGARLVPILTTPSREGLAELARIAEQTGLRVTIDTVFPFEALADALTHLASGRVRGRTVVTLP